MPNSDYIIRGIPSMLIERMWPFAEPYVKRALDHSSGEWSCDDMKQACMRRDVQLWLVSQGSRVVGAATTEILNHPQRKDCRVLTIAGSASDKWEQLMYSTLSSWAMKLGCEGMEAHVRKGMVPRLAPFGFKHLHSVVFKKLDIINVADENGEDHGIVREFGKLADAEHRSKGGAMGGCAAGPE